MNYSFTAAEELKEIAEREAVAIAEKEEQWEEHRQSMRVSTFLGHKYSFLANNCVANANIQ